MPKIVLAIAIQVKFDNPSVFVHANCVYAAGRPYCVSCCVILASKGYPVKYENGFDIALPAPQEDTEIYVAGAKLVQGKLKSAGGRVLGVTAIADTLQEAIDKAYHAADSVKFENGYCRRDIGKRALQAAMK